MNNKTTTVTVHYQNVDGYHYFKSDDVIGLRVGSSDLHKAFHDVATAIEVLMEANHKVKCTAEPMMNFNEFLQACADGDSTREDSDRTFALQMAA